MNRFKLFVVSILALALAFPAMAASEEKNPLIPYKDEAKTPYTKGEIADILQSNEVVSEMVAIIISEVYPPYRGLVIGKEGQESLNLQALLDLVSKSEVHTAAEFPDQEIRGYNTFLVTEADSTEPIGLGRTNNLVPWTGNEPFLVDPDTGIPWLRLRCGNPPITANRYQRPDVPLGEVPLTFRRKPVAPPSPPAPPVARVPEVIREHERVVSRDGDTEAEATATAEGGSVHLTLDRDGRSEDDDCFGLSPRECAKHRERMAKIEGDQQVQLARAMQPLPSQEGKWSGAVFPFGFYSPSRVEAWTSAPTLTNAPTRVDSHDRWRSNTDIRSNTDARDLSRERSSYRNFAPVDNRAVGGHSFLPGGCAVTCPTHNVCVGTGHHFHPCLGGGCSVLGNPGGSFGSGGPVFGLPGGTFAGGGSTFGNPGGTFGN